MQEYSIGVIADGWFRLNLSANNRTDLRDKLQGARMRVQFIDRAHEPIGEIIDSMVVLEVEDIEDSTPQTVSAYHAKRDTNEAEAASRTTD